MWTAFAPPGNSGSSKLSVSTTSQRLHHVGWHLSHWEGYQSGNCSPWARWWEISFLVGWTTTRHGQSSWVQVLCLRGSSGIRVSKGHICTRLSDSISTGSLSSLREQGYCIHRWNSQYDDVQKHDINDHHCAGSLGSWYMAIFYDVPSDYRENL